MKTAISVPNETFRRVEQRASALNINRSQFFARAAERYLDELDAATLTDEINAALNRGGTNVAAHAVTARGLDQLRVLTADDEW